MWHVGILVGLTAGLWAVSAIPARFVWGDDAFAAGTLAAAVCLVPSVATMAWSVRAARHSPEAQLLTAFGGSGVRVVSVLAAAGFLYGWAPAVRGRPAFWGWVLFFYLATLALEITLLVRGRSSEVRHGCQ